MTTVREGEILERDMDEKKIMNSWSRKKGKADENSSMLFYISRILFANLIIAIAAKLTYIARKVMSRRKTKR